MLSQRFSYYHCHLPTPATCPLPPPSKRPLGQSAAITSHCSFRHNRPGCQFDLRYILPAAPMKRFQHGKLFATTLAFFALAAAGACCAYLRNCQQEPALLAAAAQVALDHADSADASLKARRALELDSNSLPACKVMAELCEQTDDPNAVSWRKRVIDLSGDDSTDALISGAATALHFGQRKVARTWMDSVPPSERHRPGFEALSGAFALDAGRYADAQRYYSEALRLAPGNNEYLFSLAKAQSLSDDYFTREAGRKLLQGLVGNPNYGLPALRALADSYAATTEPEAALLECRKLAASPRHTFQDELLFLHFLHVAGDPGFPQTLAQAQAEAAGSPYNAGALLAWMSGEDLAAAAVHWATIAAPKIGQNLVVQPALGQCYLELQDWNSLLKVTGQDPWESAEYVRQAYRARALRETGNLLLARSDWTVALNSASGNPAALRWLAQVTTGWNWKDESEDALWALIEQSPDDQWASQSLYQRYLADGNTPALQRLAAYLVKAQPSNENAQNDLAILSLLLHRNLPQANAIASDLYRQSPGNPVYASTYAFALLCRGRSADALHVLDALPRDCLKDPSVAAYYGIILTSNHTPGRARPFLESAQDAPLLPEERALVDKAVQETAAAPH